MAESQPVSDVPRIPGPVVVMGVSGCGKSSVGARLAGLLDLPFVEGDDFHPRTNVLKMRAGIPLVDEDRWLWLDAIGIKLAATDAVLSCSALKRAYRDRLRFMAGRPLFFIFLHGDQARLANRMAARRHHYMPTSLLDSQMATLEPPFDEADAVVVTIDQTLEAIVRMALDHIIGRPSRPS